MQPADAPAALKISEVAHRLQVDPRTVYRMIQRGELRGVKAGRVWRVPRESLEGFLRAGSADHGYAAPERYGDLADNSTHAQATEDRAALVKAVRGKYRDVLSSVDEFIAQKQEEIAWENRRWPDEER